MNKHEVYEMVTKICHDCLLKDEAVMAYLTQDRQLSKKTIKKFQIGLFPKDLRKLFEHLDPKTLRDAEMIKHASRSVFQTWDLIMPIKNVYGKYIAIAGRTQMSEASRQKKGIAKYRNSVYSKAQHLFGLNYAKKHILESGVAYVVEGYFDVMMAHQFGLNNVVASCGAFLSTRQIILLSRYTDKIVLLFDNEDTAQDCARKIVDKKRQPEIQLIAHNPYPTGVKDIDDFIKEYPLNKVISSLKFEGNNYDIKPYWD